MLLESRWTLRAAPQAIHLYVAQIHYLCRRLQQRESLPQPQSGMRASQNVTPEVQLWSSRPSPSASKPRELHQLGKVKRKTCASIVCPTYRGSYGYLPAQRARWAWRRRAWGGLVKRAVLRIASSYDIPQRDARIRACTISLHALSATSVQSPHSAISCFCGTF